MKNIIYLFVLFLLFSCGNNQEKSRENASEAERPTEVEKDTTGIPDLLIVEQPSKNEEISSPLMIKGKARGSWYFEGQFPVELVSGDGKLLAKGSAKAEGEWMTSDFVPFSAEVEFQAAGAKQGALILRRSNASGLPENDRSYRLPVYFK